MIYLFFQLVKLEFGGARVFIQLVKLEFGGRCVNTFTARQKTLTHRQHVLSCRFNYFAQYTCTIVHSPCDILHQATHGFQTKKKVSESDHPVKS